VERDHRHDGVGSGAEVLLARCTTTPTLNEIIDDPETHAEHAFNIGLDIPSLTSWYHEHHP